MLFVVFPLFLGVFIVFQNAEIAAAAHIVGVIDKTGKPVAVAFAQGNFQAADIGVVVAGRLAIADIVQALKGNPAGLIGYILVIARYFDQIGIPKALFKTNLIGDGSFRLQIGIAQKGGLSVIFLLQTKAEGRKRLGAEMAIVKIEFGAFGDGMGNSQPRAEDQTGPGRLRGGLVQLVRLSGLKGFVIDIGNGDGGIGIIVIQPETGIGNKTGEFHLILNIKTGPVGIEIVFQCPPPGSKKRIFGKRVYIVIVVDQGYTGLHFIPAVKLVGIVGVQL